MRHARPHWLVSVASLGLLLAAWLVGPATPAIYDGLPIGTPPYRYLVPPKGSPHTPSPSSVSAVVILAQAPAGVSLSTKEPKPQADVSIPTQMLILQTGVMEVRVSVAPVPPPQVPPKDGRIDGNVYRIMVTTLSGQPLSLRPGAAALFQVELLGTGSSREPYVEHYVDGQWGRVAFVHPESGIFQFHPAQPGEFALVLPPGHSLFGPGLTTAVTVGGALVVLGVVLTVVRRRRSRIWAGGGYPPGDLGEVSADGEVGLE